MLKKILSLTFFALLVSYSGAMAQKSPKTSAMDIPPGDRPVYNLIYKIPVSRDFKYIFDEITTGKRTTKKGGSSEYNKSVRYYFSMNAAGVDDDNNLTLRYSVDSLNYSLKDGATNVNYNSQDEEGFPPLEIKDYEQFAAPLGLNFWFIYSSYGDLAQVGGEAFLKKKVEMNHPEKGIRDSSRKILWEKAFSMPYLSHFFDLKKGIIPNDRIFADSVYKVYNQIYCEGFRFADTVEYKLTSIDTRTYTLTVKFKDMKIANEPAHVVGSKVLVAPDSGKVNGEMIIDMNVRGIVTKITTNLKYTAFYKIGDEPFKHEGDTKQTWLLDKMLQFK